MIDDGSEDEILAAHETNLSGREEIKAKKAAYLSYNARVSCPLLTNFEITPTALGVRKTLHNGCSSNFLIIWSIPIGSSRNAEGVNVTHPPVRDREYALTKNRNNNKDKRANLTDILHAIPIEIDAQSRVCHM